jgi:hypothetical protein
MPIRAHLPPGAFNSEVTRLLGTAFEDAWEIIRLADGTLVDEPNAAATRERLAKRIIELGRRGERDHARLVEHAVAHLVNSRLAPEAAGRSLSLN